jgi:lipopolysaccharide assembly outer membrane protein LptD (OstA)
MMQSRQTRTHLLAASACSVLGITLLAWNAFAQPPRPLVASAASKGGSAPPASSPGKRPVRLKGDFYDKNAKMGIANLKGNVHIWSEDTLLTTSLASYNERTDIASSPGPLKIEDTLNTLVGKTGTAYYRTRDAKIRGAVVITVRPRDQDKAASQDSPRRQFDSPATITCEIVDYNWGSRIAFLTGKLVIKQKDRTVTADKATYFGKEDRVVLEGNVYYVDSKGQKFKATKVTIGIKEGDEDFKAENVEGEGFVEDTIEDEPAPPKSDKPKPEIGNAEPGVPQPVSPDPAKPEPVQPEPTPTPVPPPGSETP